jgi:uncharacterized membrane protein
VLIASGFSFFASASVLRNLHREAPREPWLLPLCLVSVIVAWALTHTSYTLRYAHLYYRDDEEGEGGLAFPGDRKPDDFDFAYFAYTIGMCFRSPTSRLRAHRSAVPCSATRCSPSSTTP